MVSVMHLVSMFRPNRFLATARGLNATVRDVFQHLREAQSSFDAIIALDFVEHFEKAVTDPPFSRPLTRLCVPVEN